MAAELQVGDRAPKFDLPGDDGKQYRLADFKGQSIILFFYPKALTPGCTQEACDFRDIAALVAERKAVVLGVSRDPVSLLVKFREKHELNFPLLSDESGEVCEAYGVWKEKSMYGKKFMGIERTTFVIGPDGKIQQVFAKVKVNGHAAAVLDTLK